MSKSDDVDSGVRSMARKLRELVWHREVTLEWGPKRISTARINLGSTEAFFDKVLEYALQNELVYKTTDDLLTVHPPENEVPPCQMKLEDVEQI